MKLQQPNKSWRQQTVSNVRRIAGVFGLAGAERYEIHEALGYTAVPTLTYLEDSQFEDAIFEEEAMLVEPEPAAPPPARLPAPSQAPALPASAFAPRESARLNLPRLPGSTAERHEQEYQLEETFRQRAAEIAAMIARRHAPRGDTPARSPRLEDEEPYRHHGTDGGRLPSFELM